MRLINFAILLAVAISCVAIARAGESSTDQPSVERQSVRHHAPAQRHATVRRPAGVRSSANVNPSKSECDARPKPSCYPFCTESTYTDVVCSVMER